MTFVSITDTILRLPSEFLDASAASWSGGGDRTSRLEARLAGEEMLLRRVPELQLLSTLVMLCLRSEGAWLSSKGSPVEKSWLERREEDVLLVRNVRDSAKLCRFRGEYESRVPWSPGGQKSQVEQGDMIMYCRTGHYVKSYLCLLTAHAPNSVHMYIQGRSY